MITPMNVSRIALLFLMTFFLGGCASTPKTIEEMAATANFGPAPTNSEAVVRDYFGRSLYDPTSLQIKSVSKPYKGYAYSSGNIPKGQNFGWGVNAIVSAKDRGGYSAGWKLYALFIKNGVVYEAFEVNAPQTPATFIKPVQ